MDEEFSITPPPHKIFSDHEIPVVEVTDSFILAYGETEFVKWIEETFKLKSYVPPTSHEKIQKEIEKIISKEGIENLKLKRILVDKYNSWGIILTSRLPRPVPILDENEEVIFSLWLTPYERICYIISDYETTEMDLWKVLKHAPRASFEEILSRIENYFRKEYEDKSSFYIF